MKKNETVLTGTSLCQLEILFQWFLMSVHDIWADPERNDFLEYITVLQLYGLVHELANGGKKIM